MMKCIWVDVDFVVFMLFLEDVGSGMNVSIPISVLLNFVLVYILVVQWLSVVLVVWRGVFFFFFFCRRGVVLCWCLRIFWLCSSVVDGWMASLEDVCGWEGIAAAP